MNAALGSDWSNAARTIMFSLGCVQSLRCQTRPCPTGKITTNSPTRQSGPVLEDMAQRRERSLRSLYCCSDDVRGRGASVTYWLSSFPTKGSHHQTMGSNIYRDWAIICSCVETASPANQSTRLEAANFPLPCAPKGYDMQNIAKTLALGAVCVMIAGCKVKSLGVRSISRRR